MRVYDGKFFRFDEHCSRLTESCHSLARPFPEGRRVIQTWIAACHKETGLENALLRLAVYWKAETSEGEWVLSLTPFERHPDCWYEKGVELVSSVLRRPSAKAQDPQIKSSQYVTGVLAHMDKKGGPHEIILFSPPGTAAEGTVANIFIVKENSLLTPHAASGILRGVTRDTAMALARQNAVTVKETFLTRHELYTADECFMTNTSSEILPVVKVDKRLIGDGVPGDVTGQLRAAFKKEILKMSF